MALISSRELKADVAQFGGLVHRIYADSAPLAEDKTLNLGRNLDPSNPGLGHVQWRSVTVADGRDVAAHALVAVDERLPGIAHVGFLETLPHAAPKLFETVKAEARSMGVHVLRGPVNFNTWQDFRAVTEDSGAPPFFLEPYTRHADGALWRSHGFEPCVRYLSLTEEASHASLGRGMRQSTDISIERVRPDTVGTVIHGLHTVALSGFSDTWSFIPISEEEFAYIYRVPLAMLDVFRIFVARTQANGIVGFLVAALDMYNPARTSLVVKSMAVHADHRQKGIGSALLAELHRHALESGLKRYIFSTMQTGNSVIRRMIGEGKKLRSYEVGECRV